MEQQPTENTYMFDTESAVEMARLIDLDQMTTRNMRGPLADLPMLPEQANVLDIACGPGGWVLDVAYERPDIEVAGIDISKTMIEYARMRAYTQKLSNASFEVADIRNPLDFADGTFDMVNMRFLVGVLRPADQEWPRLLRECMRVLKPTGVLRATDTDSIGQSNSEAFEQISTWFCQALKRAGYGFSPDGRSLGITTVLQRLLLQAGVQEVKHKAHALYFSSGSEAWSHFYNVTTVGITLTKPLFLSTSVASSEQQIEEIYQQALMDMNSDTFCGIWKILSVWGTKPTSSVA